MFNMFWLKMPRYKTHFSSTWMTWNFVISSKLNRSYKNYFETNFYEMGFSLWRCFVWIRTDSAFVWCFLKLFVRKVRSQFTFSHTSVLIRLETIFGTVLRLYNHKWFTKETNVELQSLEIRNMYIICNKKW